MNGCDWAVGAAIATVAIALLLIGGAIYEGGLVDDCKAFGMFRANGVVYECHAKPEGVS